MKHVWNPCDGGLKASRARGIPDRKEHDAQSDARWQRFLAAWAYRHSSLVSAQWPGCIVLEVRASFQLLGPWPVLQARLREELQALGFQHRIALAPTPATRSSSTPLVEAGKSEPTSIHELVGSSGSPRSGISFLRITLDVRSSTVDKQT